MTSRSASSKGSSHSRWRGDSLSKVNPPCRVGPDLDQPAVVADPAERPGIGARGRPGEPVGGTQRVGPEHVLDVHQQQFLVLLLMVQAQLDQAEHLRAER